MQFEVKSIYSPPFNKDEEEQNNTLGKIYKFNSDTSISINIADLMIRTDGRDVSVKVENWEQVFVVGLNGEELVEDSEYTLTIPEMPGIVLKNGYYGKIGTRIQIVLEEVAIGARLRLPLRTLEESVALEIPRQ